MTKPPTTDLEQLRAGLLALGLRESAGWIDGYAFVLTADPARAVTSYTAHHEGRRPTVFHIDRTMFILATEE